MSVDYRGIRDALISAVQTTGYFERVNAHEPKNAPGKGLTCAIWCEEVVPTHRSGLSRTSAVLRWTVQARCSMTREPQDDIDIDLLAAVDAVGAVFSGNFDLGITGVRGIDLLGADTQQGMGARAGYVNQDGIMYRVYDLSVPVVVNDVWTQGA